MVRGGVDPRMPDAQTSWGQPVRPLVDFGSELESVLLCVESSESWNDKIILKFDNKIVKVACSYHLASTTISFQIWPNEKGWG